MRRHWVGLALLLGGCTATGNWSKPGGDAADTASAYQDCRSVAATAVRKDVGIDQDILATRGSDLQRGAIARIDAGNRHQETGDREAAIVASCMRAKGFAIPAAATRPSLLDSLLPGRGGGGQSR